MSKLLEAHYDPKTRIISCRTERALDEVWLEPAPGSATIRVKQYDMWARDGTVGVRIGDLPEPLRGLFDVTSRDVDRLNVKIRQLGADDVISMYVNAEVFKDERLRKASDVLASLFPDFSPAAYHLTIPEDSADKTAESPEINQK